MSLSLVLCLVHTVVYMCLIVGITGVPLASSEDKTEATDLIPKQWLDFCVVQGYSQYLSDYTKPLELISVSCDITDTFSGIWRLDVLRNWIENSTSLLAFNVHCENGAAISLPWPMKAKNIVYLTVDNCIIEDFFAEYHNTELGEIPDQLRVLEIRHVQVLINIRNIIPIMTNIRNISKDFDCGHEDTIEKLTLSNITYTFSMEGFDLLGSDDDIGSQLSEIGGGLVVESRHLNHRCHYLHLRYLDESISSSFSQYHLKVLGDNSFFPEMRVYNLSNTGITDMVQEITRWWIYFPKLEMLDLSHNNINSLDIKYPSLTRSNGIARYNIQYNNITSLLVSDLKRLSEIPTMFIDFRNNPVSCECIPEVKDLLSFLQGDMDVKMPGLEKYSYIRHLECASPESVSGKLLGSLDLIDLPCGKDEIFVAPVASLSVAFVLLFIVFVIAIKYRVEIRVLMFTRFHIILPCQPKEKVEGKLYDAFVSYSSNDESWMLSVFQKLEQQDATTGGQTGAFRFCLHHRDFIPGKPIFDNVIDSVESSRHTVILVSKSFLESHFCLYEFQEAFHQSIVEKRRHLVIILMEDIPPEDMPKDLRRCLKTFTYIKKEDRLFWDRLVYALSVKRKNTDSLLSVSSWNDERSISISSSVFSDSCSYNQYDRNQSISSGDTAVTFVTSPDEVTITSTAEDKLKSNSYTKGGMVLERFV